MGLAGSQSGAGRGPAAENFPIQSVLQRDVWRMWQRRYERISYFAQGPETVRRSENPAGCSSKCWLLDHLGSTTHGRDGTRSIVLLLASYEWKQKDKITKQRVRKTRRNRGTDRYTQTKRRYARGARRSGQLLVCLFSKQFSCHELRVFGEL